jgi:SNF2 family DNA or RNA helicase
LAQLSIAEVDALLATSSESDSLILLPRGGAYRRADLVEYAQGVELLESIGLSTAAGDYKVHALQVAGAMEHKEALANCGDQLRQLVENVRDTLASFKGVPPADIDAHTARFLRPYQQQGADFLVWAGNTFGGALLADDMGLGKTLQVLAAITALRRDATAADRPALVICPASVAHNWQREAARFTPHLRVLVLESGKARKSQLEKLGDYDLVVMNYALLRRDLPMLLPVEWLCVVVDEAQAIKNATADTSRSVKQLSAQYRFALTGTPIENRLSDLRSILEFAVPNYVAGLPIDDSESADQRVASRSQRLLRSRLRPVLLRRLKSEVATELPERIETRIDCEMGTKQRKLYLAELKRARTTLEEIGDAQFRSTGKIQMLALLMRLRQICCDPVLIDAPQIESAKVDQLVELVAPLLEAGHKVLLFSQFVQMLKHLQDVLTSQDIATYMLHGGTKNRQPLVDAFQSDERACVFLVSLKAGGTGLNLTAASHVVLFDPWWNPAVEAQAIDRSHRIGQDKTVVAYRLVTLGTIEERILELQERKRALVRGVLEEESFNRALTREDFKYLLEG